MFETTNQPWLGDGHCFTHIESSFAQGFPSASGCIWHHRNSCSSCTHGLVMRNFKGNSNATKIGYKDVYKQYVYIYMYTHVNIILHRYNSLHVFHMLPNYWSGNLKPFGSEHPTKSHRVFDIKRLGSDPNSGGTCGTWDRTNKEMHHQSSASAIAINKMHVACHVPSGCLTV